MPRAGRQQTQGGSPARRTNIRDRSRRDCAEDPAASELVKRIDASDPKSVMPPPKSNRRLTAEQKKLLEQWIRDGAAYAKHWAFVAPQRPAVPTVKRTDWVRTPIDAFVLAKLEREKLAPSPEADRPTLIRRLSIDLTGLPPTPKEVDAFVADADPEGLRKARRPLAGQ